FLIFGRNAITAYIVAWFFAVLFYVFNFRVNGELQNGHNYIFLRFFAPLGSPSFASLLFSLAFVLLCLIPLWLLDRKKIFLRDMKEKKERKTDVSAKERRVVQECRLSAASWKSGALAPRQGRHKIRGLQPLMPPDATDSLAPPSIPAESEQPPSGRPPFPAFQSTNQSRAAGGSLPPR